MELSLFSVSYAGLWGQASLDVESFIRRAGQLGYRSVMLAGKRPHLSPLDARSERLSEIRDVLESNRVRCVALAAYVDLAGGAAAEVPYLEMQMAYVESLASMGRELGTHLIRVFTAYESDSGSPHGLWVRVVSALREMCDRAAAHGCTLAIQNHHDVAVHTDALHELLHDVDRPNCRLGFDAWSPALRGEKLYEVARQMAPYTAMTTNADYVCLPRFQYQPAVVNYQRLYPDMVRAVKFGEGFIDYEAFFQGLTDGGFRGLANYEMCSPVRGGGALTNLDSYATHYVRWMTERNLGSDHRP